VACPILPFKHQRSKAAVLGQAARPERTWSARLRMCSTWQSRSFGPSPGRVAHVRLALTIRLAWANRPGLGGRAQAADSV